MKEKEYKLYNGDKLVGAVLLSVEYDVIRDESGNVFYFSEKSGTYVLTTMIDVEKLPF